MLIKVILHHPVKFRVNLSESSPLSLSLSLLLLISGYLIPMKEEKFPNVSILNFHYGIVWYFLVISIT